MELNKIYPINCLEGLKQMPNDYVDMVITSPPYNVGGNNMTDCKYKEYSDNLSGEDYFKFIDEVINEMIRVTKNYVFFNIQILSANKLAMFEIIGKHKNNLKEILIWNKKMVAPAIEPGVLNSKFEFIFVFTKNNPHKRKFDYCFFEQGRLNNVIEGKNNSSNKWAKQHAAAFPDYFVRFFVKNFSKEKDIILDPFVGTGTVAFVSKMENRQFIGFDINKEYVEIANDRLRQESVLNFCSNETHNIK